MWRAVTSSSSAARWLPHHAGWLEPPPEVFSPDCVGRFRSQLRGVPVNAELRVLEVRPGRLRTRLRIGLVAFDARFAIGPEPGSDHHTRVGLAITIANELPVVSGSLDRFAVRRLASELAEQMLSSLETEAEAAHDGDASGDRRPVR